MLNKQGFTLIEIIVVMVIIGILASIAVPTYNTMMQQQAAKTAQNNLITIYNAQKNFYFTNGYYCSTSSQPSQIANCADTQTDLNTNLSLNITDNFFTYACSDPPADGGNGITYTCTATYGGLTLTLTNSPIVLPGGSGGACTAGTGGPPCNPYCTAGNANCPS